MNFEDIKEKALEVKKALIGEEGKISRELEKALQRREDLLTLPLPKEDLIAVLQDLADHKRMNFLPMFKHRIRGVIERPLKDFKGGFNPLAGNIQDQVNPTALAWFFPDQIKKGIARVVEAWDDYPTEVGPTRAERIKEIPKLDKTIETLQAKLNQLREIDRIQPDSPTLDPNDIKFMEAQSRRKRRNTALEL